MQHFMRYQFGVDLRRWREKNDFTQFEFAACIGVTPTYISQLENFVSDDHQIGYLARVCDGMGVDIKDYITDFE